MGVTVQVQHCNRRIWTDDDFRKAGATIVGDVSQADIVVGIKEVPISELSATPVKGQTHFMFSHTHKGQSYNMDLLSRLLGQARLIDYELLTDHAGPDGKRTIAFGWYAGAAGLVEGLCAYSRYLLTLGIATPILHLPRPFMHASLSEMRKSLKILGRRIQAEGVPREAGPIVVAVTGAGQVAAGALDMLKELPAVLVQPLELGKIVKYQGMDLHKVYVVHAPAAHYLQRKDGRGYNRNDYYCDPDSYHSVLYRLIAPYVSLIVNGAGWRPGFPRLMDNAQLTEALRLAWNIGPGRLGTISDVTCDLEGGLEFVTQASTIDTPVFVVKPSDSLVDHPGVSIVSIDILPTELPRDTSVHFSNAFMPYLVAFVRQRLNAKEREHDGLLIKSLDRATIVQGGKLLSQHEWLSGRLTTAPVQRSKASRSDRGTDVLVLGSGMVAKPVIDTLCQRTDLTVVLASNNLQEAQLFANVHPNLRLVTADASDRALMEGLICKADVVISLLPAPMHPKIAEICIQQQAHLVTASYVSPVMQSLHEKALSADVLLLNECGLDPGVDHCAAVDLIQRIQNDGKQVRSFISFCGGLPAPEFSNVPLGYKFSWAPHGVLMAAKNSAHFKLEGEVFDVPGEMLLKTHFSDIPLFQGFALEGLANRNSINYIKPYKLGQLETMSSQLRGTLRYKGFTSLMSVLSQIGLLDETSSLSLDTWSDLLPRCLERVVGLPVRDSLSRGAAMTDVLGERWYHQEAALEWLGLLPSLAAMKEGFYPTVPEISLPPLSLLSILMSHRLRYEPGERDVVILSHEVVAGPGPMTSPDTEATVHSYLLVVYGDEHSSAMARTVGLPVAFAALRILDGDMDMRGVVVPTHPRIYANMLKDLATVGLVFRDTVTNVPGIGPALRASWTHT
ncbi:hypothetical protein DACRYDRAFT_111046 [Dacryopinax primogenitus]|uniref:Uncharacterized protein n=1 Tax=Dacryopinax primogenitus (strain DJM 731) TaxID=1858805 RepID=M5FSB4_DACPD|nr:uncharacterized protein DACRYDRAFT_111046 [Dacryopinax primogenitus]EJT98064.1 hypothetical protein DACRYDRAFT_111046 [Dacryopinax primogenitus]